MRNHLALADSLFFFQQSITALKHHERMLAKDVLAELHHDHFAPLNHYHQAFC